MGRENDLGRHGERREKRGERTERELTTSEVGRGNKHRDGVKQGRDLGRGRVGMEMGREGDAGRCVRGLQRKRGENLAQGRSW